MKQLILQLMVCVFALSEAVEEWVWSGDRIVRQRLDPDGTKYAVLYGQRECAGQRFTCAFWMPGD